MDNEYKNVTTRFLRQEERLMSSDENQMPLVIEARDLTDIHSLKNFLNNHSEKIKGDIANYGAVLLRGFDIHSDEDFETTVLSIQGFKGINQAFMSEYGRNHVKNLQYVLHTNEVYKTGGTLYLGGFHCENYYVPDVPSYICFYCVQPSLRGGETGLINMEKIFQHLENPLKEKLEKSTYFTAKWLISDVAQRYQVSIEKIEEICKQFDLPIVGKGKERFILMYKPCVFEDANTKKKALSINLFELPALNIELRKHFKQDYQGKDWFWHRFMWKVPNFIFKFLEYSYMTVVSLIYSRKKSLQQLRSKLMTRIITLKQNLSHLDNLRVSSCFDDKDIKHLAKLTRQFYSSCLWKKGDILLVNNKKVAHTGMPGAGPRVVRAMICNPIEMNYSFKESGLLTCKERSTETIGSHMES